MKDYIDKGLDKVVKEVAQEFRDVTDFIYKRQNERFEELDKNMKEQNKRIKKGLKELEKAIS